MTFGKKLKEARNSKGYTQRQLAEKIGAKHNSISNWEKDQNHPDPDTIELICGILNVSANYFFGENDSISPAEQQLLTKYRALDTHGKEVVMSLLDAEWRRIENMQHSEIASDDYEPEIQLAAKHSEGHGYSYNISAEDEERHRKLEEKYKKD